MAPFDCAGLVMWPSGIAGHFCTCSIVPRAVHHALAHSHSSGAPQAGWQASRAVEPHRRMIIDRWLPAWTCGGECARSNDRMLQFWLFDSEGLPGVLTQGPGSRRCSQTSTRPKGTRPAGWTPVALLTQLGGPQTGGPNE